MVGIDASSVGRPTSPGLLDPGLDLALTQQAELEVSRIQEVFRLLPFHYLEQRVDDPGHQNGQRDIGSLAMTGLACQPVLAMP